MSRGSHIILIAAVLALATGATAADDPPAIAPDDAAVTAASATTAATAPAELPAIPAPLPDTPEAREIRQAREVFAAELGRLSAAYRATRTPETRRELDSRIAALKFADEVGMLEIQARYAREAGRIERADELDRLVTDLRAVAPAGAPGAGATQGDGHE